MQYPYYPSPDKFIPNSASINAWLKTRKNNSNNKPGIFETVDYNRDRIWSIASILIELAAFYFTFLGAYSTYLKTGHIGTIIYALIIVSLFIVFDIVGIMLHGQDKPQKTINKSLYLVSTNPIVRKRLWESLNETTSWREFIGFMLLSISAVLKIFALWNFLQGAQIYFLIIFGFLYVLVIYIHIFHTVYWWPARKLKKSIKKQSDNFQQLFLLNLPTDPTNTITTLNHYSFAFSSEYQMPGNSINTCANGRINIVNSGKGKYVLNAIGTIWDENIVKLSSQWGQEYASDLINACITVQLLQNNIIVDGTAPAPTDSTTTSSN
jgi:hypothetical protein